MDSRIGTSRSRAASSASGPHGYQSTGLSLCCSRYGEVSPARRLGMQPRLEALRADAAQADADAQQRGPGQGQQRQVQAGEGQRVATLAGGIGGAT